MDWLDKLTVAQFLDHPKVPVSAKNRVAKAGSVAFQARHGQKTILAKVDEPQGARQPETDFAMNERNVGLRRRKTSRDR